jgi:hypothetical protein
MRTSLSVTLLDTFIVGLSSSQRADLKLRGARPRTDAHPVHHGRGS